MEKIVVMDNEYATVWCYPEKRIIHHQFHQFTHGESFNNTLIQGAEAFEKYRCTKWLSDDRELGIVHPDNAKWGEVNWTPKVVALGWKYWASLMPTKTTGQMSLKAIAAHFQEHGVTVEFFTNTDEAMRWLEQQP